MHAWICTLLFAFSFAGDAPKVGIMTTYAGTGKRGFSGDGGLAPRATLSEPFHCDVDAAGKATAAHVYSTPGKNTSDYMTAVLLRERYKPALCAGTPCAQQYLFTAQWSKK